MPLVDRVVADGLALEVVGDRPDLAGRTSPGCRAWPRRSRRRPSARRRGGRPSRRSPGRRSPSRRPAARPPRTGRSAHWPVNRVIRAGHVRLLRYGWVWRTGRAGSSELLAAALSSTASRTRCTGRPSANDGDGLGSGAHRHEEVADLVGERVLVAEHVARRPPRVHVRVLGLGDKDAAEALRRGPARGVEEVELVQVLEVEQQGSLVAVDLQLERVLPPGGEPGDLERGDGPGGEGQCGPGGVVDRHAPPSPCSARGAAGVEGVQPPETSVTRSPRRNRTRSIVWAPMSPSAPDPAVLLVQPPGQRRAPGPRASPAGRRRARAGWCRAGPRAISSRASATAGTRR